MKIPFSPLLLMAGAIQVACQLFKVVFYSLHDKRLSLRYFFSAGGIPSAHSAFVSSLTLGIGLQNGFHSDLFAVSFVFSAIVIYDAYRLRGAVERHAKLLNRLTTRYFPEEHEKLNEMVGHTLWEIISGILVGSLLVLGMNGAGWFNKAGMW